MSFYFRLLVRLYIYEYKPICHGLKPRKIAIDIYIYSYENPFNNLEHSLIYIEIYTDVYIRMDWVVSNFK